MVPNDGVIGTVFLMLAVIVLIVIGVIVSSSLDLAALIPASVRPERPAAAGQVFPAGVVVAVPGSPGGEQIPYPVVDIGEAQTVFPQAPPLPPV